MMLEGVMSVMGDTVRYWVALWTYVVRGSEYQGASLFGGYSEDESLRMGVYVYSLALALKLWKEPHYRKSSYAADVRDNFCNVAIPGTGVPLSVLAVSKTLTTLFLCFAYPVACFAAAVAHARREEKTTVSLAYREQLLAPRDWFSLWRINSRLAAWHSLVTRGGEKGDDWGDYAMENKWAFLEKGLKLGVAVSPVLSTPVRLCVKHKNEEGGLGIYFFKNALAGGDWIIQEVMDNADDVAKLLPADAPLSTFRVMTASNVHRQQEGTAEKEPSVFAMSCVFRAGRAGAATDHSSILFDVDIGSGILGRGTTNQQWYQLGKTRGVPWGPPAPVFEHPDKPGSKVTGYQIPDFKARVLDLAIGAHEKLLPGVPIAGWDVVLSKQHGPCLLEVNLSCNFFRGSFDEHKYFNFIHQYFLFCQRQQDKNTRPLETIKSKDGKKKKHDKKQK